MYTSLLAYTCCAVGKHSSTSIIFTCKKSPLGAMIRILYLSPGLRTNRNVSGRPGDAAVATSEPSLLTPTNWLPNTLKLNVTSLIRHSLKVSQPDAWGRFATSPAPPPFSAAT